MTPKTVNKNLYLTANFIRAAARRRDGSVMVGVLAAVTFIGIVVGFMLKSTQSQAASIMSYSSVIGANLATSNGIMATESYFSRTTNEDSALAMMGDIASDVDGSVSRYIFGGVTRRYRIGGNQYFSSRLVKADESGGMFYAQFEVEGSVRERGNALKKAAAFYEVDNVRFGSTASFGGSNAIYLGGSLEDGNNGMEVLGDATFMGGVKLQNKSAIFHGTTWVNGDLDVPNSNEIRFADNTYVGGASKFHFTGNNIPIIFERDIGFEGNITMNGGGLSTAGDIYMNGNQIQHMNKDLSSVPHDGVPKSIYTANGMGAWNDSTESWNIGVWGTGSVKDFDMPDPNGEPYNIPAKLGMNLESRREPDLDISVLNGRYLPATIATSGSQLSVDRLHDVYDSLKLIPGKLFNDHLVLNVSAGMNINFPNEYSKDFARKVIFVLEDGASWNVGGRFYNSADTASTMVYVKPGAKLDEFGCSGLFRGLIYVDSANTLQQGFNWGGGSEIEGAVLLKGSGSLKWNTGAGESTKITRDPDALKWFAPFVPGGGGETTIVKVQDDMPINLYPIGIYFY